MGAFLGEARTINPNAIRELKPSPLDISISLALNPPVVPLSDHGRNFELNRVFALEDFERFVFVMSVLDCPMSEIRAPV